MKTDLELDQHLRRTLAAVAATVQEVSEPTPIGGRRKRRALVAAGAAVAVLPLAAAVVVNFGPEYVDEIPPPNPIISGSIDGQRYWVVDGREIKGCEKSPSGIELIAEQSNIIGQEWNTTGAFFGEPDPESGCARKKPTVPPEHTYYSDGGTVVGDAMVWMGALHPAVDEVRADLGDGPQDVETFEHEGGSYYVLEVPPGTGAFTIDYLVGGQVLPPPSGESAEHVLPEQ